MRTSEIEAGNVIVLHSVGIQQRQVDTGGGSRERLAHLHDVDRIVRNAHVELIRHSGGNDICGACRPAQARVWVRDGYNRNIDAEYEGPVRVNNRLLIVDVVTEDSQFGRQVIVGSH